MIPVALLARIEFTPGPVLRSPWAHEVAHELVKARTRALLDWGLWILPKKTA